MNTQQLGQFFEQIRGAKQQCQDTAEMLDAMETTLMEQTRQAEKKTRGKEHDREEVEEASDEEEKPVTQITYGYSQKKKDEPVYQKKKKSKQDVQFDKQYEEVETRMKKPERYVETQQNGMKMINLKQQ